MAQTINEARKEIGLESIEQQPKIIDVAPKIPPGLGRTLLEPFEFSMAAGLRHAAKIGVPTHNILEMQANMLASFIAMIEPAGARMAALKDLIEQLPGLVGQHVTVSKTTAGGVLIPNSVPLKREPV